ncbi:hypothetical protein FVR03_18815 [Pontibacter qinzhouensis]|uniref:TerB family tellurite resistance protein n=1 Tax=Pontibacter qinzhouensis TaxID=2603253 RepID=A0A5C8JAQ4_9BACT|nr:hypothetical protein [Pontibacter qinzhouensis]TXK33757.1 hypothetical protein FVR03_18815 [Pontibacter qinzhouensis]
MKAISRPLLLLLLLLLSLPGRAQTWEEWFRQQKTKKDYLVQQIAALQAYAGTLRDGYALITEGMHAVQHSKNGDLGLHQAFFGNLKMVNPAIGNAPLVTDILSCQAAILRLFGEALAAQQQPKRLQAAELDYFRQVKETILQACLQDLETLALLLSSRLELRDEERLRQLEALHGSMRDKYAVTRSFTREAQTLALQRAKAKQEAEKSIVLHGLK